MPGGILSELHELWLERQQQDEYLGPLVNAYLATGGKAFAYKTGRSYVDVGTLNGYRAAIRLLSGEAQVENSLPDFIDNGVLQPDINESNALSIGELR